MYGYGLEEFFHEGSPELAVVLSCDCCRTADAWYLSGQDVIGVVVLLGVAG
jgi:hypothetical protein